MAEPPNEYFTTSIDRAANRAVVEELSAQVVTALRPDEAIFTDYAFDQLMELAEQGEVARAGSGAQFGFPGAELLLMIVVPALTGALTALFVRQGVAGVGGLDAPVREKLIDRAIIEQYAQRSGVRLKRGELDRLEREINQFAARALGAPPPGGGGPGGGGPGQGGPPPGDDESRRGPYCGYEIAALQVFLAAAFSMEELRNLCVALSVDDELIFVSGEGRSGNVRRLIGYFGRRGIPCVLVETAREERPQLDWDNLTPPTF